MASSASVVKTTTPSNDDFFLCRAFAKAISSDKLLQIIEQQPTESTESIVENIPVKESIEMTDHSLLSTENNQWKIGDLCLCPYTEDGLLYKATIIQIDSSSCTVSFDDYGNEEAHPLTDLHLRTENEDEEDEHEQQQQQQHQQGEEEAEEGVISIDEHDILPPPPPAPLPLLNVNDGNNDTLSATLMSWYLAGYHTGFYQGIKNKK